VPEKERGGKPDRGSNVQTSDIEIPRQRLSEFRKLAEKPLDMDMRILETFHEAPQEKISLGNGLVWLKFLFPRSSTCDEVN
jgi:hypothetical protein